MSKDQAQGAWDARSAFHRATMVVYQDLGDLIGILTKEPDPSGAFEVLDGFADLCPAPEPGDADLIARLKDAVGRLRASLATVEEVRKKNRAVRWNLGKGDQVDRCLGGIGCASFHDCIRAAATEMLDAKLANRGASDPNWFRLAIIKEVSDKRCWKKWRRDLEREHEMAVLLPLPDPGDENADLIDEPDASTQPADPSVANDYDEGPPIKLFVYGADGVRRGGFFTDYQDHKYEWPGVAKEGLREIMLRTEAVDGADTWYRIELVEPRVLSGSPANGSLVDHESRCYVQTPPQAMHWFLQQPFGPPPYLVERVTQFASDWAALQDSPSAKYLLRSMLKHTSVDEGDDLFAGHGYEDLRLLQRLGMVHESRSSTISYRVDSVVRDAGADSYVAWMNAHMAKIKTAVPARSVSHGALGFHETATSLLDQAQSIVRFRMHWFPEWEHAYPRLLPLHLRMTLTEFKAAEDACRDAQFLHQEAVIDRWYDPLAQQVIAASQRSPAEVEKVKTTLRENLRTLAATTSDRLASATREMNEAEQHLRKAEQKLTRDWLADRAPTLRRLLAEYESQLAGFGPALPGLIDLNCMKLGRFGEGAASACEVLQRFATAVGTEQTTDHFEGLDPDQLRVAVVKEIAFLVRRGAIRIDAPSPDKHAVSPPSPPPPPSTPPVDHPPARAPNPPTVVSDPKVARIEAARIAQGRAPAQNDHVEKWVLDVLRQEPNRHFKLKDLMSVRRRPRSEPCPVARSALSEALARLRTRNALGYSRFRYSHKQD